MVTSVIFNLDPFSGYAGDPVEGFLAQARVVHRGVKQREGMAVGMLSWLWGWSQHVVKLSLKETTQKP